VPIVGALTGRLVQEAAGHWPAPLPAGQVRLIYRLGTNEYQGEQRLQLVVEHLLAP